MQEVEKYHRINKCETVDQLAEAILYIADEEGMIQGRSRKWKAIETSENVMLVVQGIYPANALTREYGIRQQALYIKHYSE